MEEKDPGYTTAPNHRKSLSGTIIGSLSPIITSAEVSAQEDPTPSQSGPSLELSDLSSKNGAIAKKAKKLIKKVSREQRIMILGHAASGKSTVGNAILGKNLFPVQSPVPASDRDVTDSFSKKKRKMFGKCITVVETQGLSDSGPVDDSRNFGLAAAWLSACFPGPHVFVFVMNLFAYHQMMCQNADEVHWLAEKGVRDGGGAPVVNEKQCTWQEMAPDSDVEQGGAENMVSSRPVGEQDQSRKSELLSIQKYFGDEALKNTILVLTHGDKLNPMTLENLFKKDPHLKSLIRTLGGNQHVDCSSSSSISKANAKKLMQVIDEMLLRNDGQYYTPKWSKKGQKQVKVSKLLHLPFPLPPTLANLDVSPEGIARVRKILQKMAMGAVIGSLTGAGMGATLKMATLALKRVGYLALLFMPLILGTSSSSSFPVTGGLLSVVFIIMIILGAIQGCIIGGRAATDAQTFKDAARMGAKAVVEKEKKNFKAALQALVQKVSCGCESPPSGEDANILDGDEDGGSESGEPSENRTMNRNAKVKDRKKQLIVRQKEETANSELFSSSISQQQSTSPSNSVAITPKTSASEKSKDQNENVKVNTITVEGIVETKATPQTFYQSPTSESGCQQLNTSPSNSDTKPPKTSALQKSKEQHENGQVNTITVEGIVETKATPQTEEPENVKIINKGGVKEECTGTLV